MLAVAEKTPLEAAKEISDGIEKSIKDFHSDFDCQRCGKCCQEGVGVALWPYEFKRLKGLDKDIYKHITTIGNWYALKLPCAFYNSKKHKCRIYNKRPLACRMYPMGVKADGSIKFSDSCTGLKLTTSKEV
jgi:Fe-S-cluster containining protein